MVKLLLRAMMIGKNSKVVDANYGRLFEMQKLFAQLVGAPTSIPPGLAKTDKVSPHIMEASIGLVVEASEILDALNKEHRIWAQPRNVEAEVEKEAIDVLFYLLELFNVLGLEPETVMLLYLKKYVINLLRFLGSHETDDIERVFHTCRYSSIAAMIAFPNKMVNAFGLMKEVKRILDGSIRLSAQQRQIVYDTCAFIGEWLMEKTGHSSFE